MSLVYRLVMTITPFAFRPIFVGEHREGFHVRWTACISVVCIFDEEQMESRS
jgi:hypothetical protein